MDTIVEVSQSGRAPKNDPAIFALAMCSTHREALDALPLVCRIGTHLFQFLDAVESCRGGGRGLRRAVAAWYEDKEPEALAYQVAKYQQRGGWSHWDAIRLSHPEATTPVHSAIYDWICMQRSDKHEIDPLTPDNLPSMLGAMEAARDTTVPPTPLVPLIQAEGLTREMIPTEALKSPDVWEALLERMPYTAMIRNLGNMSKVGLLVPFSDAAKLVQERLANEERLRKARVHPLAVLIALKIYAQGHGMRGSGEWQPVDTIVDALDAAFYLAFGNVEPTGKRMMLALDVSSSMSWGDIAGMPLTPREASAAMAMVTARTEPEYMTLGFSHQLVDLGIRKTDSLDDAVRKVSDLPFGGTDCSLPMRAAEEAKLNIDAFIVYTDSETWAGPVHPHQALVQYRKQFVSDAKLVVVGMLSNGFTIADPADAGMLDCCGFDTATPQLISDFVRGF